MKIKRTLPPSGSPLYARDLLSGMLGILIPAKALRRFEDELRSYFGVNHVFLVSSGKAALTLILQSLSEITGKEDVVIPSYACFSVPSAVVKAGLRPVICDVGENDLNYDMEHLKKVVGSSTLCVVVTHLFGIPCDVKPVLSLADSEGCFVVEDCAQAMGAELSGRKVGTLGDVGFFSLGRGKTLCAVSGGIIVTSNQRIADALSRRHARLRAPGFSGQLSSLFIAMFLYIFSRPSLYWFPAGLPFLKIGQTIFSTEFPIEKLAGLNAGLAARWKSKLGAFNEFRRRRAEVFKNALNGGALIHIQEPAGSVPAYLRYPIIAKTPAARTAIYEKLSSAGLGASLNYPTGIAEIPQLNLSGDQKARYRMGNILAERILTIPTHSGVLDRDVETICKLAS